MPAQPANSRTSVKNGFFSVQNSAFCMCFAYLRPASRLITVFRLSSAFAGARHRLQTLLPRRNKKASTGVLAKHG
jgi:hypothetical protein